MSESIAFKIRGGADTYMKHDGKIGTAGKGLLMSDELAFTVAATQDQQLCQPSAYFIQDDATTKVSEEVANTIRVGGDGGSNQHVAQPTEIAYTVRRLTPTECERLQGFPDGWTDIGDWVDSKGKTRKTTDGNRYKALGNSFAVPVMRWLGERIELVNEGRTDGAAAL